MESPDLIEVETENGSYLKHRQAVVDMAAEIGTGTKIWEGAHIFGNAKIGSYCIIAAGVHIENGTELGDFSKVQRGATLYNGVKAGSYVFIGPNATTTNDRNPRAFGDWELAETIIETGASIGANATLIAGNRIGALSIVGSGTVVTKPVRPGEIVVGNPGVFLGWADVAGHLVSRNEHRPQEVEEMLVDPMASITKYLSRNQNV